MANRIVKDSGLAIFVKEIAVPQATAINALVRSGAKVGLCGDTPRKGEDGNYYTTVDTAALVRLASIANAFTDGQTVYMNTSTGAVTNTATTSIAIGYADRPKGGSSGDLWVQLVPITTGA